MTQNYTQLNECVACGKENLHPVMDLGKQPLANSYKLTKEQVQEEYPLAINVCYDCWHVQLTHTVDPKLMFEDYLYVSGTTQTGREHFKEFAGYVDLRNKMDQKSVLDVGCNDGTQLDYFKELGYATFGVDPAKNLLELSSKNHNVFCDYFNDDFTKKFTVQPSIIVAQNVFAHTSNPLDFLLTAKKIMPDDGKLFIQTSQANMIRNGEFDTIYHEHISFFCVNSMEKLCERAGMVLTNVDLATIHGTSFIFEVRKEGQLKDLSVDMRKSAEADLYNPGVYVWFAENTHRIKNNLLYTVNRDKYEGYKLVGYGAPAKGMTVLNFTGLDLDFIIDDNPLKQNRFTPGSSIPIYASSVLYEYENDNILFVPLAWNFYDEIKRKVSVMRNISKGDTLFCRYFPKMRIDQLGNEDK